MLTYILKRLLLIIPTLIGALTLTFIVIQFVPGGPVEQMVAELRAGSSGEGPGGGSARGRRDLDAKQIEEIRKLYGFDKPPLTRYFEMLGSFARFDLGRSFMHNKTVWELIKEKMPVSISLGLWTFLLSYLISIPLGVAKAIREGSTFDTATTLLVLVGFALPGFVLGVLLIVLFAGGTFLDWFPLRGLTSDNWETLSWPARILDYLWHLVLPLTCYAIGSFATITLLTKNTFVEEIRKQYVLVARAKGVSSRRLLYKHVFRNALIPIVTGFPAALVAAFFAGSLLIETLFSLDGLGYLSYESIVRRDYPVVLGTLYFFTLIGLMVKLIGDLLYVVVDPRVQFAAAAR
jgi:microcin C transport system permease protein